MTDQHFYKKDADPCSEPIPYKGAGIGGIYLCNGYEREEVDGEWFTWIDDLEGLHKAIALHLVLNRKALAPNEFRFIRNTMDMTQAEVAAIMRVDEQTVARWEKGKTALQGAADTVLRSRFLAAIRPAEELKDFVSEQSDKLVQSGESGEASVTFVHDPDEDAWKEGASEKLLEEVH